MKKNDEEALYKWFRNAQSDEIMRMILSNRDSYPNCMKVINSHCDDYVKKFRKMGLGALVRGNRFDQDLYASNEGMVDCEEREEREEIYKEIQKWIDLKKSLKSAFISDIHLLKV